MVPTIDLSLIGILLIIWNVIKTIWSFVWGAIKWAKDNVAAAVLGSKLWATAAFLALSITVISLSSVVINAFINWFGSLLVQTIPIGSLRESITFVSTIFPLSPVSRVISTYFGCWFYLFTLKKFTMWYCRIVWYLNSLKSSWKT